MVSIEKEFNKREFSLILFLSGILFFLMLITPRFYSFIKGILLIIIVCSILIKGLNYRSISLSIKSVIFFILFISYSILTSLVGAVKNNPGWFGFFRVNVIWIIVFTILVMGISNFKIFKYLLKTIIFSSTFISVYNIIYVFVILNILPQRLFIKIDSSVAAAYHIEGYIHITSNNLSMQIFCVSLIIGMCFIDKNILYNKYDIKSVYLYFALFAGIIVMILSGRRILWLIMALSLICNIILQKRSKNKKVIILFLLFITLIIYFFLENKNILSIEGIYNRFISVFNSDIESERADQINALWKGFLKYPIIGSGAGIGVKDVVRSIEYPWQYETSYSLILYNSGIIGMILYISALLELLFLCFFQKGQKHKYAELAIPISISLLMVYISNASNPYFSSSFDYLWFLFFPLSYLNLSEKFA